MIQTRDLTKTLGGRPVVSGVTFRCEPGTVTGFLGPNGAGKTTTMRMLVGLSEPDRGDAQILDEPANGLDPEGMRWMRGLLRGFAPDRMMIIGGGQIRAQGTRAELLTESGTIVAAGDLDALDEALRRSGLRSHPADGGQRLVDAEPAVVAQAASAAGVVLHHLAPAEGAGLEHLFFALTAAGGPTPPAAEPTTLELTGASA